MYKVDNYNTGRVDTRYAYRRIAYVCTMPARTITGASLNSQNGQGGIAAGDLRMDVCPVNSTTLLPDLSTVLTTAVCSNIGSNGTTNWTFDSSVTVTDGQTLAFVVRNVSSDPATKYTQMACDCGWGFVTRPPYTCIALQSDDEGSTWTHIGRGALRLNSTTVPVLYGSWSGGGGYWAGFNIAGTAFNGNVLRFPTDTLLSSIVCNLYRVGSLTASVRASIVDIAGNTMLADSTNTIPTSVLSTGGQRYNTWYFNNVTLTKNRYYGIGWSLTDNVGDSSNYVRSSSLVLTHHSYSNVNNGTTDTDTPVLYGSFRSNTSLSSMLFYPELLLNAIFDVTPLEQPQTTRPLNLGGGFTL